MYDDHQRRPVAQIGQGDANLVAMTRKPFSSRTASSTQPKLKVTSLSPVQRLLREIETSYQGEEVTKKKQTCRGTRFPVQLPSRTRVAILTTRQRCLFLPHSNAGPRPSACGPEGTSSSSSSSGRVRLAVPYSRYHSSTTGPERVGFLCVLVSRGSHTVETAGCWCWFRVSTRVLLLPSR